MDNRQQSIAPTDLVSRRQVLACLVAGAVSVTALPFGLTGCGGGGSGGESSEINPSKSSGVGAAAGGAAGFVPVPPPPAQPPFQPISVAGDNMSTVLQLTERQRVVRRQFYGSVGADKVEVLGATSDGAGGRFFQLSVAEHGIERLYASPPFPPDPLNYVPTAIESIVWQQT